MPGAGLAQFLREPQDVFSPIAPVMHLIAVMAHEMKSPPSGSLSILLTVLNDSRRIELRPMIAQLDGELSIGVFDRNTELLLRVTFQTMFDDVAGAFFQNDREAKQLPFAEAKLPSEGAQ